MTETGIRIPRMAGPPTHDGRIKSDAIERHSYSIMYSQQAAAELD